MIEAATDNKDRTAADIRPAMSENHGSLGVSGGVAYMFHRKGKLAVPSASISEDKLLSLIIDAGAEGLEQDDKQFLITTPAAPPLPRGGTAAKLVLRLCDAVDDVDDVMTVHANFELTNDALAAMQAA